MMRAARRASLLVAFYVLASATLAYAESGCTDLSGKYYSQGEDGSVIFRIRQVECNSLEISRENNYLGQITNTKLSLKADGIFRWFYGGLYGGREAYMIAGRFVRNTFEITSIPPFSSKSKEGERGKIGLRAMSLVDVYSLDLNRNLRMAGRHYDSDGNLTYDGSGVAVRDPTLEPRGPKGK